MSTVICLRHFETEVDPETPPSEWTLSEAGRAAMEAFVAGDTAADVDVVYTSPEQKALGTAEAVADDRDADLRVEDRLREVDRSGEGFIEDEAAYEELVEQFFRAPEVAFDWEHRLDAEARIYRFVADLAAEHDGDDTVLLVSHGLLLSTMLAPVFDRDRYEFWRDLEFGAVKRTDVGALRRRWR